MKLATEPTHTVQVAVTSGDTGAATVSPATLNFSTSGWDTAQTITVDAQDDSDRVDEIVVVTLIASSTDPDYQGKAAWVFITVIDDDRTAPGIPISLSAKPLSEQVTLTWQAPSDDGGSPITGYEVKRDTGTWVSTGKATPGHTATNLTNGTEYSFRVRSLNTVGAGPEAGPVSATPPAERDTKEHQPGLPWAGHDPQDIQKRQYGELADSGDQDWYRMSYLAADRVYEWNLTRGYDGGKILPSVSEPKLTVYNSSGNVVMKHGHPVAAERIPRKEAYWNVFDGHKSGPSGYIDPYLFFIPETSGTYYLSVTSVIDDTGHYELWYDSINTENKGDRTGRDCSDSIDTKCRISSSGGITAAKFHPVHSCSPGPGCNDTRWDNDTWWVYLEYGLTYNLCINSPGRKDGFSSPSGKFNHAEVKGKGRGCTTATPQFRTKGYEVKVGGRGLANDGSETRDYLIYARKGSLNSLPEGGRLSSSEPAGGDFPGDNTTNGYVQANGEPAKGRISSNGDTDWFLADLVATHMYRVDVKGSAPGDPGGTLADPSLGVSGPGYTSVNEDGGTGENSRLEFTVGTTGTFTIRVSEEGHNATGTYSLIVTRILDAHKVP